MSLTRRLSLLEWARSTNAWILEDDYDSEFRYVGRPLAALQGLDKVNHVIYLGTFIKVLFPALRLGYLVVPLYLVDAFVSGIQFFDKRLFHQINCLTINLLKETTCFDKTSCSSKSLQKRLSRYYF
jgi:GntR family transcriptional regulator/MocR family aminotransferase